MPPVIVRARLALIAAGAAALALASLAASPTRAADGGAFFTTLGNDTLAAESYVRMDTVLAGTMVVRRDKMTVTQNYTLWLDKSGNLAKYEMARYAPGTGTGDKPLLHTIVTPMGNGLHEVIHTQSAAELHVDTPPSTLIMLDLSFAVWETFAMRAVRGGKDSTLIPMLFVNDTTHYDVVVRRLGADSVTFTSIYGVGRAKIDAQGHILGYHAPGSTQQVVVRRLEGVDLKAFAAMFANRPFGPTSPMDSLSAKVGGATLRIWYGRPAVRGRTIFGGVVPWNVVWRTGANEATSFTTDKDIVIGGTPVPAGAYTLFTLPNAAGWKLIISKRTKEWGTEYDPTADLARIDMSVATLAAPVERLTYTIMPQGTGATLTVSWDKTAASVAVRSK
jgi:Protein of unknown function (DUF2911)